MAASSGNRDPKGDKRRARSPSPYNEALLMAQGGSESQFTGTRDAEAIAEHMLWFASQMEGYLRYIPDGDQKKVYIKWKWSTGRWSGHYVMSVVDITDIGAGLFFLRRRVQEVEDGYRTPTRDQYMG